MDELLFFDTLRQGLWVAVITSVPILTVALVVGLAVGLFQALTSIQEMTLTFVPKALAVAFLLFLIMPWMVRTLMDYTTNIFDKMPSMVM